MSMSDEYSYSMLVTFCLGSGQMAGTFLMGMFIDRESISFLYNLSLVILISNLMFVGYFFFFLNALTYYYILAFIWGIQDSCINTHTY